MVAKKGASVPPKSKKVPARSTKNEKHKGEVPQQTTSPSTPVGSMGPVVPKNPDLLCPHLTFVRLEKLKRKILTPTAWSCSGM